jgi:Na+/proline symporter
MIAFEVIWALIVISVYIALCLGLGYYAYLRTKHVDVEDYYVGKRQMGWLLGALTLFATFQSGYFMFGAPGLTYSMGISFMVFAWGTSAVVLPTSIILGLRIRKISKETGAITPGMLIFNHYKSLRLVRLCGLLIAIGLIPYVTIQYIAAGYGIEEITRGLIPYWLAIVIFIAITLAYTLMGGFRAVVWTDFFQGLFFWTVILVLGFWIPFAHFGGLPQMFEKLLKEAPQVLSILPGYAIILGWIAHWIAVPLAFVCQPQMFQRVIAAKSDRHFIISFLGMSLLVLIGYLGVILTGLGIRAVGLKVAAPDRAVPAYLATYSPLLGPVIVAAALAAMMSTSDSLYLSTQSLLTLDWYKSKHPEVDPKRLWRLSVYIIIGVTAASAVLAFIPGLVPLIVPFTIVSFNIAAGYLYPLIGMLFWRRATEAGAIVAMLTNFIVTLTTYVLTVYGFLPKFAAGFEYVLWGHGIAAPLFVITSLLTSRRAPTNK